MTSLLSGIAGSCALSSQKSLAKAVLTSNLTYASANSPIIYNSASSVSNFCSYSTSSGVWTATTTGWYIVQFSVILGGITTSNVSLFSSAYYQIYRNGSVYKTAWESNGSASVPSYSGSPGTMSFQFLDCIQMTPGETLYPVFSSTFPGTFFVGDSISSQGSVLCLGPEPIFGSNINGFEGGFFVGQSSISTLAVLSSGSFSYTPNASTPIVFNSTSYSSPFVSYSTGTGFATVQVDGVYLVLISIEVLSYSAFGTQGVQAMSLGTYLMFGTTTGPADSANNSLYIAKMQFVGSFVKGDTVGCALNTGTSGNFFISGNPISNFISMTRLG